MTPALSSRRLSPAACSPACVWPANARLLFKETTQDSPSDGMRDRPEIAQAQVIQEDLTLRPPGVKVTLRMLLTHTAGFASVSRCAA